MRLNVVPWKGLVTRQGGCHPGFSLASSRAGGGRGVAGCRGKGDQLSSCLDRAGRRPKQAKSQSGRKHPALNMAGKKPITQILLACL